MKNKTVIIALSILFVSTAGNIIYASEIGAPEPLAKKGELSMAIAYSRYVSKLVPKDSGFRTGTIRQNQSYLQFGYGLLEDWEGYFKFGIQDLRVNNAFNFDSGARAFQDKNKVGGMLGFRGLLYSSSFFGVGLGVGPVFQAGLSQNYRAEKSGILSAVSVTEKIIIKNLYDINLGIGVQTKPIHWLTIFGGPFAYWEGFNEKRIVADLSTKSTTTFREKNNFGGFVGVRISPGMGTNIEVEGQFKNEPSVGALLSYAF